MSYRSIVLQIIS